MADLLQPRWKPLEQIFLVEFAGMTSVPVSLEQLEATQVALLDTIRQQITPRDADFLLSLKRGQPDWSLFALPYIEELPAMRWKLSNILAMAESKREDSFARLERVLQGFMLG
jgi:hypothetical protein